MKSPTIYHFPHDENWYVNHSDYAALAAENERLKAEVKHYIKERTVNSWSPTEKSCELILNEIKENQIARLTAEKEALVQQGIRDHGDWRSKLNFLEADYKAEVARLTAENERLRKAGDAMMVRLLLAYGGVADSTIEAWLAAKEGSDAK